MWVQNLFSKKIRDNRPEYGGRTVSDYNVLTPEVRKDENALIRERVGGEKRQLNEGDRDKTVLFAQDCPDKNGGRYVIGVSGPVKAILGEDSPFAHELPLKLGKPVKGRPILFTHGFFELKSRKPTFPNLEELLSVHRAGLEETLRWVNEEDPAKRKEIVDLQPVEFKGGQGLQPASEWERITSEIAAGKHPGRMAIFSLDGKFKEWIEPEIAMQPEMTEPTEKEAPISVPAPSPAAAPAEKAKPGFFKKLLYTEEGEKLHFGKVTAVSAAVLAVGAGAYYLFKPKNNRADTWAGKEDARRQGGLAQAGQQM